MPLLSFSIGMLLVRNANPFAPEWDPDEYVHDPTLTDIEPGLTVEVISCTQDGANVRVVSDRHPDFVGMIEWFPQKFLQADYFSVSMPQPAEQTATLASRPP